MNFYVVLLLVLAFSVEATMQEAHQSGRDLASGIQQRVQDTPRQTNLRDVPGFQTEHPPEASLKEPAQFSEHAHARLQTSEAGTQVVHSAKVRPQMKLDPNTDPLFRVDLKAQEKSLGIDPNQVRKNLETVEKICETGGEEITYSCVDNRVVTPNVPLKSATLAVNHLVFEPRTITYTIPGEKGGFWKHGTPASTGSYQDGWVVRLPQDIHAFKAVFCPNFVARDVKNSATFNIDCTHIESYQVHGHTQSVSDGQLSIVMQSMITRGGLFHRRREQPEKVLSITLNHRTYEGEATDEWHSNCQPFEQMVEEGYCHYVDRVLTQGPEIRTIQGYSIYRDDWQYTQHYACQLIKDECGVLRADPTCHPIGSRCKEMKQGRCWLYEQRYQCESPNRSLGAIHSPADTAFCLSGDCHSTAYTANGEMLEAISRLKMLKDIQDEIQEQKDVHVRIFKGSDRRCHRNCLNFNDCCRRLKGWGVSLGLAECNEDEKELAKMREQHLCHEIGTTCVDRDPIFKTCLRKETSFCCFGTRLSRLLQEQGRPQLGLGWGEAESPNCQGLTVSELSRLDLSKINFSELFEDLMKGYRTPDTALKQRTHEALEQRLQQMTQEPSKIQKPGKGKVNEQQDSL